MAKKLPEIAESAKELLEKMGKEKHGLKRQRLHALYLVRSGQVETRQELSRVLGVGGNAVGKWMKRYQAEGLAGLMEVKVPPGRVATLCEAQVEQLREALARPSGFGSYVEVQAWIGEQFGVAMAYDTVHKLVRYRLGATLKVARPTHPKKTQVQWSSSVTS